MDHVCVELSATSLLLMGAELQECWEKSVGYQGPWKINRMIVHAVLCWQGQSPAFSMPGSGCCCESKNANKSLYWP